MLPAPLLQGCAQSPKLSEFPNLATAIDGAALGDDKVRRAVRFAADPVPDSSRSFATRAYVSVQSKGESGRSMQCRDGGQCEKKAPTVAGAFRLRQI